MIERSLALVAFLSTTGLGHPWMFGIVVIAGVGVACRGGLMKRARWIVAGLLCCALVGTWALIDPGPRGDFTMVRGAGIPLPIACASGVVASIVAGVRFQRTFVLLVCIEVLIGFLEATLGVRTLIPGAWEPGTRIGESDLLYLNRVFGLGPNSSAFAMRVLWAIAVLGLHQREGLIRRRDLLALVLLCSSFTVNLSRAALVASALSILIFAWQFGSRFGLALLALGSVLVAATWDRLWMELNRGLPTPDLSGRDWLSEEYLAFIAENPVLGNGGIKYYIAAAAGGLDHAVYHAHNSYLQVAATSGIPTLLFLLGGVAIAGAGRVVVVVPLLLYSLLQYGVFWGASLYDQLFWAMLFGPPSGFALHVHRHRGGLSASGKPYGLRRAREGSGGGHRRRWLASHRRTT